MGPHWAQPARVRMEALMHCLEVALELVVGVGCVVAQRAVELESVWEMRAEDVAGE